MPAISALDYEAQTAAPPSACCAGCANKINDRYYLLAVDRPWHVGCLKCSECKSQLDTELTCFARDGNIYCKEDYYRLFAVKRCARCQRGIFANELVMRARELVYHLHCFTCAWCNAALAQGDYFGLRDNLVYCRTHYELLTQGEAYGTGGPSPPQTPGHNHHHDHMIPLALQASSRCNSPAQPMTPNTMTVLATAGHPATQCDRSSEVSHGETVGGMVNHLQVSSAATPYSHAVLYPSATGAVTGLQGGGGTTVRKGRPRKRKSGDQQQQGITPNNQLGVSVMDPTGHCGGGMGHMGSGLSDSSSPGGMAGSGQMPNGHHGGPNGGHGQRTKRMRTSFKHHQLRTMKSYFSINQNPDAKDLKQLAQKTGLSKRVLQVWFQNARAKWRRNNLKSGDGSQGGSQTGSIPGGHQSSGSMHHHSMSGMPGSPGGTSSFSEPSPAAPCGGGMGPDTPGPHSHHGPSLDYNGNGSLMGHHHVSDSLPLTSFQELF